MTTEPETPAAAAADETPVDATVVDVPIDAEHDPTGDDTPIIGEIVHVPHDPQTRMVPGTNMPIVPIADEMRGLAELAVTLSAAGNLPRALRDKPADVFFVLLTARDLGVSLTTALREFHVIDGKVTTSPKVRSAMVRQQGLGRLWPDPDNDEFGATWFGERVDQPGIVFRSTFTIEMADTVTFDSWEKNNGTSRKVQKRLTDKDNWKNYRPRMLSWRALGYLLDDCFPEVGTGLYSPDEMGAVTDENGNPVIDLDQTDPLVDRQRGRQRGTSRAQADHDPPANPAEIADLRARIDALGMGEARAALLDQWQQHDPRLPALNSLLHRHVVIAKALVDSIEKRAGKGEWADAAAVETPEGAPESPETPSEAVSAPDTPEPDTDATHANEAPDAAESARIDDVVARVKKMSMATVDAELVSRQHETDGNAETRRARLARVLVVEEAPM